MHFERKVNLFCESEHEEPEDKISKVFAGHKWTDLVIAPKSKQEITDVLAFLQTLKQYNYVEGQDFATKTTPKGSVISFQFGDLSSIFERRKM